VTDQTTTRPDLSPHEANYNLIAAALATAAATMLTLLTTIGTTPSLISGGTTLKGLFEAELLMLEFALIISVVSLLRTGEGAKRKLVFASAFLLILGTLFLWTSATMLIFQLT
jgi:hypothetical protein